MLRACLLNLQKICSLQTFKLTERNEVKLFFDFLGNFEPPLNQMGTPRQTVSDISQTFIESFQMLSILVHVLRNKSGYMGDRFG